MALTDGLFGLTPRSKVAGQSQAINFFMHSLAEERGSRAIGIVFSGTGFDGTLGLGDIKMQGGLTFVQTPETAKFDGMPRSAVDSGCADFVLAPKEIAQELQRINSHPHVNGVTETGDLK